MIKVFAITLGIVLAPINLVSAMSSDAFEKTNGLIQNQNIESAFKLLKQSQSESNRLSARASLMFGKIYLEIGQPNKASEYFEKVLFETSTLDSEAYAGLARAALELGNIYEARQHAFEALEANPDSVEAKIASALSTAEFSEADEIDKQFRAAIKSDWMNNYAARMYASYLLKRGKTSKAEEVVKTALIKKGEDAPTFAIMADILWAKGDMNKSVEMRIEAERLYRDSGNIIKANEMVARLNFEVAPKLKERNENTKPKTEPAEVKNTPEPTNANIKPEPVVVEEAELKPSREAFKPRGTPDELPMDLEKSVVTGSGTIIGDGSVILTNRHVIEGLKYVLVRNGLGEVRRAEAFELSDSDDLALLFLEEPYDTRYVLNVEDFNFGSTGENVFVMGYPMAFTFGAFHPTITTGIISNQLGFGETAGEMQITAEVNPGNSGGPVFNKYGEIIGVATGGINKQYIMDEDGFIPDGINYVVTTERVLDFIEVPMAATKEPKYIYDAENLYKYMRSGVVFIIGQE